MEEYSEEMSKMDDLREAADEAEKIKLVVLQLLRTQGVIAFDASTGILDPELEKRIKGKG